MPIPARLQTSQAATDRRSSTRHQICLGSSVDGEPVTIHDLSATGMLIETTADLHQFDAVEIELPEAGATSALIVWGSGRYFGCEFKEPIFPATVSAARLRSPPAIGLVQVTQPLDQVATPAAEGTQVQDHPSINNEKAPVATRLRVIFGSAIVLWALIIWAIIELSKLLSAILE